MFKKKDKLLNISEVALKLNLINKKNKKPSTHTLRFWEAKFKQLKPIILGGRRYYDIKSIKVLKMIFFLLKNQVMTVKGAIKVMNENLKYLDDTNSSSIKADYHRMLIKK